MARLMTPSGTLQPEQNIMQENIVTISKQRARLAALESQAQLIAPEVKKPI